MCSFYDPSDHGVVRAARQVLNRMGDLFVSDSVERWSYVGALNGSPIAIPGVTVWAGVS